MVCEGYMFPESCKMRGISILAIVTYLISLVHVTYMLWLEGVFKIRLNPCK